MLQLTNIRKSYTTGSFTQNALDGVSLAFRRNEFAAVLGPSGSGKTTMLNIIGGLDQYDTGELEIDGVSTKKYKDRDWDTYRNNRIGFVFQSYNLIPHQTILSNVELALTLSGVSKSERRERAISVLEEVDLAAHMRKKPGQLSGGQMQRVAIARALINNPEILLADEPTGAIDTETSKQVMDLLTKIAKDRLVIMVTHNTELAEMYATRIINLKDGKITSDSHPFVPDIEKESVVRSIRKASMSFFTAISLSFSNLMTKKARTFVTAFAGSIGIIGIAAILAMATGINAYIKNMEEETLSLYPLTIQSSSFDFSSMFGGGGGPNRERPADVPDSVREMRIVRRLFSSRTSNDLASLKTYFDENEQEIGAFVNAVHYSYDITPQIYLTDTSNGIDRVNPDSLLTSYGIGAGGSGMSMGFGGMSGMNVFSEMPGDLSLFENQYEILAGQWPQSFDEAVLVLSPGRRITDFELYTMGLRDRSDLKAMIDAFMNNLEAEIPEDEEGSLFTYSDLMSAGFVVVNPADIYHYDDTYNVWVDRSSDTAFMESLIQDSLRLRIVGIVQPDPDSNVNALPTGVNYTPALISYLMENSANTQIVKDQLARPSTNVITGRTFADEQENPDSVFDFSRLISIDEDALRDAFGFDSSSFSFDSDGFGFDLSDMDFDFDMSGMNIDLSGINFDFSNIDLDLSGLLDVPLDIENMDMPELDMSELMGAFAGVMNVPPAAFAGIVENVMMAFINDVVVAQNISDPIEMAQAVAEYMADPLVQGAIAMQLAGIIDFSGMQAQMTEAIQSFFMSAMQMYMEQMMGAITAQIQQATQAAMQGIASQVQSSMQQAMQGVTRQIQSAMAGATTQISQQIQESMGEVFAQIQLEMEQIGEQMQNIDGEAFAAAFQINMGEEEILGLMMAIMNPVESTYERNLSMFGYAEPSTPSQISIYPRDFESKQAVLDILERYNNRMEDNDEPEKVVRFIDIVGVIMSSVTEIVDMVSYGLIAFVSVSLVVSSIMIGVITFISVLERKKEIGILRAIGASKQNIRHVFNAETLIIGFVAGVLGVLVTYLIVLAGNRILYNALDIANLAQLPISSAIVLVLVSMFLTFIAGIFPASAAARKNPVEALRSE